MEMLRHCNHINTISICVIQRHKNAHRRTVHPAVAAAVQRTAVLCCQRERQWSVLKISRLKLHNNMGVASNTNRACGVGREAVWRDVKPQFNTITIKVPQFNTIFIRHVVYKSRRWRRHGGMGWYGPPLMFRPLLRLARNRWQVFFVASFYLLI